MLKDRETIQKEVVARYASIATQSDAEAARKAELIECEVNAALGHGGYYYVGKSLQRVNDEELFKVAGFKVFEEYAEARFRRKHAIAYRAINIAKQWDRLIDVGGFTREDMPDTASPLAELLDLKNTDNEVAVYKLAVEKACGLIVRLKHVMQAKTELGFPVKSKTKEQGTSPQIGGESKKSDDAPDTAPVAAKGVAVDQDDAANKQGTATDGNASDKANANEPQADSGDFSKNLEKEETAPEEKHAPVVPLPLCLELADQLQEEAAKLRMTRKDQETRIALKEKLLKIIAAVEDGENDFDEKHPKWVARDQKRVA